MQFCLDVRLRRWVSAPVSQSATTQIFDACSGVVPGDGAGMVGSMAWASSTRGMTVRLHVAMALWHLACVGTIRHHVLLPICCVTGIWLSRTGQHRASPVLLPVISTASDFQRLLINADVDLAPDARRFGPPCLRAVRFAFNLA